MECKQTANLAGCSCTSEECERRGRCCECVRYHLSKDQLPKCLKHLG